MSSTKRAHPVKTPHPPLLPNQFVSFFCFGKIILKIVVEGVIPESLSWVLTEVIKLSPLPPPDLSEPNRREMIHKSHHL